MSSLYGGDGEQVRQDVPKCQYDYHNEDKAKKSSSEANKQKEEDVAKMALPGVHSLTAESPP